jgi:catechol 2,3-dioxygenase
MNPLPAATHMGAVELSVSDLAQSLDYYQGAIGLALLGRENGTASLGAGDRELLRLVEEPGARPAHGYSGLFHFALLLPDRASLGQWLAHAARERVQLTGASDHSVSEALYLRDPDYHGIEIYADRPREQWEGRVGDVMTTLPLDLDDLVASASEEQRASFDRLPGGTVMGHVHLCVADVDDTVRFYRDDLGFDLIAQRGSQAAFLSAGGYHHHLGSNTWESRGAPAAPPGTARLLSYTILVPGLESAETRQDPSGNTFVLQPGG